MEQMTVKKSMAVEFHDSIETYLNAGWLVKFMYVKGDHYFWALLERRH